MKYKTIYLDPMIKFVLVEQVKEKTGIEHKG